ncbi:MAG: hypothetical protein AAB443_03025 [Patescibacteria group bacterium]
MGSLKYEAKRKNRGRDQILMKDLKILWSKAGGRCSVCKAELVHEKTEKEQEVVVGVNAHIVADSTNGPRGSPSLPTEQRRLYDNLILLCMKHNKVIDTQLDTYTVEKLRQIKKDHEVWVSEKLVPTEKFSGKQGTPIKQNDIPILDLENVGGSGGPNGHFLLFKITNNSQTQKAIDCIWEVRGLGYSFRDQESNRFNLQPNFSKEVTYRFDTEKLYQEDVPELSLVMEFKDIYGNAYFTRRELLQVRVRSGAFYTLERGITFYPAEQIVDIGIKSISEPYFAGDNEKCHIEISLNEKPQIVTIGVSRTFLTTWGVINDTGKVRAILTELGDRVVRKMILKGVVEDYMFITSNFPSEYQSGFEGYKKLRDSL